MVIKLELEQEDCNYLLASLGKEPFNEVSSLLQKIVKQGNEQIEAYEEVTKDTPLTKVEKKK